MRYCAPCASVAPTPSHMGRVPLQAGMQLHLFMAGFQLRTSVNRNQTHAPKLLQPTRAPCGPAGLGVTGWA